MTKTVSLLSALLCTFIWGTTFIAQETGMDNIGPFTFNTVRFFVGFLAVAPLAFIFERKKFVKSINKDKKTFTDLAILIGLSLFLEQHYSKLLYYIPMLLMLHFLQFFMFLWCLLLSFL